MDVLSGEVERKGHKEFASTDLIDLWRNHTKGSPQASITDVIN